MVNRRRQLGRRYRPDRRHRRRLPGSGHPLYTGPIARAADDIDLSLPAGLLVSAAIYLLLMTRSSRAFSAFLKAVSAAGLSSSRQS